MSIEPRKKSKVPGGVLVAGIVACAACCAGPIIAIVGGVGVASLLGSYWAPALLIVTALAVGVTAWLMVRRRRAKACAVPQSPQPIDLQTTRPDFVSVEERSAP